MAVLNQYTPQYNQDYQAPAVESLTKTTLNRKAMPFVHTQVVAGDATSTVKLRRLPPGQVFFTPGLSPYRFTDFGGTADIDIGYGAYKALDGTTVVASVNAFDDAVDVSGAAGKAFMGSDAASVVFEFNSLEGVDIIVTVNTSAIPDAAVIEGELAVAW